MLADNQLSNDLTDLSLDAPSPMLGEQMAAPEFEPSASVTPVGTLGKINEPPKSDQLTPQQDISSSFSSVAPMINEFLEDDETDRKWKILQCYQKIRSRSWFKTFRSPFQFCAVGKFSAPKSKTEVIDRLRLNSQYYFTNYIALSLLIFSYSIISQPLLVVCIGLFVWMWMYATSHEEIMIFKKIPLRGRVKFGLLGIVTSLVIVWMAGSTISFTFGLCSLLIFMHALFHGGVNPESLEDFEMVATHELP